MAKNILNKSELTRQLIIEKSAPIFNKKGIAGTSLSDLAKATGLTKGSIYGNFKDKNDVAISVFKYNVKNLTSFLKMEIEVGKTFTEKLLAIPNAYRKLYKKMIAYGGCPILNTAAEADDTHKELCELTNEAIDRFKTTIVHLIEEGIKAGEFKKDANPSKIADVSLSLIEGGSILAKVCGQNNYLMNSLDQIEALIRSITATD